MSPRSQNAPPSIAGIKFPISPIGVDALGDPRKIRVHAILSSACHPELSFNQKLITKRSGVKSRTFGFMSGNIASPSKSENCQDNFRDLLRFILSLGH